MQVTRSVAKRVVALILVLGAAVLAAGWWWQSRHYEETDDAQVDGHIYPLSARVGGHVVMVAVESGTFVHAGALLVRIETRDYEVALARAQAEYDDAVADARASALSAAVTRVASSSSIDGATAAVERARADAASAEQHVREQAAGVAAADAAAGNAKADVQRYRQLLDAHEISEQQFDRAATGADVAAAHAAAAESRRAAAQQEVAQAAAHLREAMAALARARVSPREVAAADARAAAAQARVARARAGLDRARLDLHYTEVRAPVDGIVGKRAVHVGQNVQPGENLLAVVPLADVWVTANFKEDQLAHMRAGQDVEIAVDAYGRTWHGRVTSIGGATGARYSLFPPENATGNYVKVVQRLPVRIDLVGERNASGLLRPGMSVVPSVRVR